MGTSVEQRLSLQQHMKVIPKTVILVKVPRQFIFDKPLREYIQDWKSQVDGNHETSRCSNPKKHNQNKQKKTKTAKKKTSQACQKKARSIFGTGKNRCAKLAEDWGESHRCTRSPSLSWSRIQYNNILAYFMIQSRVPMH